MKKIIIITLFLIISYFFLPSKPLVNNKKSRIKDNSSVKVKVDSVVIDNIIDQEVYTNHLEEDSETINVIKATIKNVRIDSSVFISQIIPPIKKYHQKLFNEDYRRDSIKFKPSDFVGFYRDDKFIYMKASPEFNNRIVEEYTDSTCTIDFNYLEDEEPKGVFYEGRGHSVIIPIVSYINIYNNTSLIEDDFDYDGNDDLLVTTYWFFGGNGGLQTKFLFLKKDGKYKLSYEDNYTQDGYDYSKNGILFGSVSEYGEGSAGCCPSHFYDTETKFIDGRFKTIKKTLTSHLVKGEGGRWDYVDVKMID